MSQKDQRSRTDRPIPWWLSGLVLCLLGGSTMLLSFHHPYLQVDQSATAQDVEFEANRLNSLGLAYLAQKQYSQAIASFRQSVDLARKNPRIVGEDTLAASLNNLGAALFLDRKLADSEQIFRETMRVMEALRDKQQGNELLNIQFFDSQQSFLYRTLQQVLVAQGKVEEALEIAERGRAQILIEQLIRQKTGKPGPPNAVLPSIPPFMLQDIQQIAKNQNLTLVEYSIFPEVSELFIPSRVQDELQNKPVMLYIWVVQPNGRIQFKSVDLTQPPWQGTTLSQKVSTARVAMGVPGRGSSIISEPLTSDAAINQLQVLQKLLIAPIAEFLPQDPDARVVFVPQESLFLVPFAALKDGNGKYLIENHAILTAPSIQALSLTHQRRQQLGERDRLEPAKTLIVGNPVMPVIRLAEKTETLSPLLGAEQEAIAIANFLKTQPLLGKQATKTAVLARIPQARLIHLATHGLLDDFKGVGIPGAIALAPTGNGQPNDGLLMADEILGLNLQAELVVLSACDTGRGRLSGDGVIGLSRSLIRAGVPSLIVSLWSVPDAPTAELMVEFYRNWQERKLDKAQALRQAMLSILKRPSATPKDWAGFTLIGESE